MTESPSITKRSRFKLIALVAIPLAIIGAGLTYAHQGGMHHGGPMSEQRVEMHLDHMQAMLEQDRRVRRAEIADRRHPQGRVRRAQGRT